MTQKDKELLLKDLTARLPYGVKCINIRWPHDGHAEISNIDTNSQKVQIFEDWCDINDCKPYLRPMSSMTEEEKEELKSKCIHTETEEDWEGVRSDVWGIQILDKYDTRRWDNPI